MIASLGMYDLPDLHAANDQYWAAIRAELGFGPERLTRDAELWDIWQSPDLLLAQTCGYPYRARLHGTVELVGTPDHELPGCPPGHYCSELVVRSGDSRHVLAEFGGAPFAYNEALSQSGWAAPIDHMRASGVRPGALVETGGHVRSAEAVAGGQADIAGIDALTWRLLGEHAPELAGRLRVLDRTAPTPALPYITARGRDVRPIFAAVTRAIARLDPEVRKALHLSGLVAIAASEYLDIPTPQGPGDD